MTESPKYLVKKPMPGLAVGDLIEKPLPELDYYCKMGKHPDGMAYTGTVRIDEEEVRRNPDYFQLIETPKWTDSDMKEFAVFHHREQNFFSLEHWIESKKKAK